MISAFATAWRGLWRGRTLLALVAATALAHFILPDLARSDGSLAGRLEMHVRLVCGTVAAIVYASALAISCGSFSRDREDELLPLILVRPASAVSVAFGRWLAIVAMLAVVLAANAAILNFSLSRTDYSPGNCSVHYPPSLPPASVTAARMMEQFLASDETPEAVKRAPRAAVLSLLTSKENERYEVVRSGKTVAIPFDVPAGRRIAARVRFSTLYNIKETANGEFSYGNACGSVSNSTQSVIDVPLEVSKWDFPGAILEPGKIARSELVFRNEGGTDVMFRPRRDVSLLVPGDSFLRNSVRASVQMLALAALLGAFGLFLSAALSRPVAIFTAAVLLAAALMAPDAISQFPDEFNATAGERMGLAVSRAVAAFTSAFSEASPVSDLASGRAIRYGTLAKACALDFLLWPAVFFSAAAVVLRRRVC